MVGCVGEHAITPTRAGETVAPGPGTTTKTILTTHENNWFAWQGLELHLAPKMRSVGAVSSEFC